jgi:hypothetical protein
MNKVFKGVTPCDLLRADVSEESIASIFRVRIFERLLLTIFYISPILLTLMTKAIFTSETSVLKRATEHHTPEDDILPSQISVCYSNRISEIEQRPLN